MLMAAPIGAIQAESQRAAAAAQPLCSWRLFWSGADFDLTDPKQEHRKLFCATTGHAFTAARNNITGDLPIDPFAEDGIFREKICLKGLAKVQGAHH